MARSGASRKNVVAMANKVPQKTGHNNGKGKGGGGNAARPGKGGTPAGQWLFVPSSGPSKKSDKARPKAAPRPQMQQMAAKMMPWMTGKGGGKGSQGKGKVINWMNNMMAAFQQRKPQRAAVVNTKNKANGKGNANKKEKVVNVELEKLQPLDASLKVWVAGLDEKANWKKVREHFQEVGKNKVALMPKGKACIAFESAAEAENAIASLNGSSFGGKTLEVDVWTQRENKAREPGSKKKQDKKKALVNAGFAAKVAKSAKSKKDGKKTVPSKFWEKLKALDHSLKVKVSNLPEGTSPKKLKDHFKDMGADCKLLDIMTNASNACVGFASADQAESAVAIVGGSDFEGNTLEVAAWGARKAKEN